MPRSDLVLDTLKAYVAAHGDADVPYTFTVPADDEAYPKETRGLAFGRLLSRVRSENSHQSHREQFEALGFSYDILKGSARRAARGKKAAAKK